MHIRNYNPETDYPAIEALYQDSTTYGGQFDPLKDSKHRLDNLEAAKPGSILVAEVNEQIVGTVTLLEDGRSAWLFRFAVQSEHEADISAALYQHAKAILQARGHQVVIVYAPENNEQFEKRYAGIGFTKGNNFTAYWHTID